MFWCLGKSPFRRYQRSLTDTAFIFERAYSTSGSTSPLSPSARSPFSRSPSTSSKCPTSPLCPPYRTIPSPQRPQTSPPTSPPPRSVPPVSPLPSLPVSRAPPLHRPPPQAPVHDSASPASPKLLDSQEKSESRNYDSSEELAVATEPPPATLTENPLHTMGKLT